MEYGVHSIQGVGEAAPRREVGLCPVEVGRRRTGPTTQEPHSATVANYGFHEIAAEVAGAARDENLHTLFNNSFTRSHGPFRDRTVAGALTSYTCRDTKLQRKQALGLELASRLMSPSTPKGDISNRHPSLRRSAC